MRSEQREAATESILWRTRSLNLAIPSPRTQEGAGHRSLVYIVLRENGRLDLAIADQAIVAHNSMAGQLQNDQMAECVERPSESARNRPDR